MGACSVAREYAGTLTDKELQNAFSADQDADRYESGHSYSGGIGMLEGLTIQSTRIFETRQLAAAYVDEQTRKWGPGLAVKFKDIRQVTKCALTFAGKHDSTYNGLYSNCIVRNQWEPTLNKDTLEFADQVTRAERDQYMQLYETATLAKAADKTAEHAFKSLLAQLQKLEEPFAGYGELKKARTAYTKTKAKHQQAAANLKEFADAVLAKHITTETVDNGIKWLVGGVAAE